MALALPVVPAAAGRERLSAQEHLLENQAPQDPASQLERLLTQAALMLAPAHALQYVSDTCNRMQLLFNAASGLLNAQQTSARCRCALYWSCMSSPRHFKIHGSQSISALQQVRSIMLFQYYLAALNFHKAF